METSLVTTKGQVVIPFRIRKRLKIKKGTKIGFVEKENEVIIQPLTKEYVQSLRGSLGTSGKVLKALIEERQKELKR